MGAERVAATAAALALAVLVSAMALRPLEPALNNDLWIHLETGRAILGEGRIPDADRYSFTAAGERNVVHEPLPMLAYALGERIGGYAGIAILGAFLPALALLGLLLGAARSAGAPLRVSAPVALLAFVTASWRVIPRPDVYALATTLACVWLLVAWRERAHAGRSGLWLLVALVPVQVVWVNSHASFPLAILLALAFAGGELADATLGSRERRVRIAAAAAAALGTAAVAAALATREPRAFGLPAAGLAAALGSLLAASAGASLLRTPASASARHALPLVVAAAALAGAVLLNPAGIHIFEFIYRFGVSDNAIVSLIGEWTPLVADRGFFPSLGFLGFALFAALTCGALALGVWRGSLTRTTVAVVLLFGILPLRHTRWMPLCALALAPFVAATLAAARRAGADPAVRRSRATLVCTTLLAAAGLALVALAASVAAGVEGAPGLLAAVGLAGAGAAFALVAAARPATPGAASGAVTAGIAALLAVQAWWSGIPKLPGFSVRPAFGVRHGQPLDAIDLLRREGVPGRLFTEYAWSGWAIHALWPDVTIFLDSRNDVYGERWIREWGRIKQTAAGARLGLDAHGVDLVLVEHRPRIQPGSGLMNAGVLGALADDPRWTLLYVDDAAALFARTGLPRRLPDGIDRLRPQRFAFDDPANRDAALEVEARRALERAPGSAYVRGVLAEALHAQGRADESRAAWEQAWAASPRIGAVALRAGELALARGDVEEARTWLERAREAEPTWERAREALEALGPTPPGR